MNVTRAIQAVEPVVPAGSTLQLILAATIGVAVIIVLITWLKVHPFLALSIGAVGVGVGAGMAPNAAVTSFGAGFGSTMAGVGVLVGFGAMFGKLLADSGGADRIVDALVSRSSVRTLPWTMALIGGLIGLPMFFEVGLVLLIPVIILVARRSGQSLIRIAIPALAGLSVMHGLVPPHPGPLVAVTTLSANLGLTLAIGVLIAIPTVIISGPLFSKFASRWVKVPVPEMFITAADQGLEENIKRPSFIATVSGILLPVVLMLARSIADAINPGSTDPLNATLDFLGTPMIAPVAASLGATDVSLMVLAIGAGSLFLSHVNDAGFWLVKEYLGTSVPQTLKTWTVMECLISVTGLAGVLLLNIVI
jgi:GntP family gluconate:H+ symporter